MKNRVRWLAANSAALVAGILLLPCSAPAAGAGWYTSYEEAVAVAQREGKPIFADFSTSWCGMCRQLEQQTFPDPAVSSRLDNFVKLHIDAEQRADIAQRYNVQAYPTMVMLDPTGRVVNTEVGFVKPRQLSGALDKTMQMVGPALALAKMQAAAQVNAKAQTRPSGDAESEAQRAAVVPSTELPPSGRASTSPAYDSEANISRPVLDLPNRTLAKEAEPAPAKTMLATLEAPKLPNRDASVGSLLRGKPANGEAEERLLAQASTNKAPATAASEEVEELPRPLLGTAAARETAEPTKKPEKKATPSPSPKAAKSTPAPAESASAEPAEETPAAKTAKATPATKKSEDQSKVAENANSTKGTASTKKDPLATIRKLQNSRKGENGDAGPGGDKSSDAPKEVTSADVARWIKDADTKLIGQRKREARAMYGHVVEKDPENKHGKTDMAFIKMVSLMVDDDDDALRLKAYNKIKEFEARFPDSPHKDYYTLIRATLAADLGEINSAHKLLENYTDRFPDSKYQKLAYDTWKTLPPVKKETSAASSKSPGGSSTSSSGASKSSGSTSGKSTGSNQNKPTPRP